MCGIVGYIGNDAARALLDGLTALEYRGYDSAGLFIPGFGARKAVGPVSALEALVSRKEHGGSGIAHTRWATHGIPTEQNAHPHADCAEQVWVVHNGIIENYQELKTELQKHGHTFRSETDSEVLAHLIEDGRAQGLDTPRALTRALKRVRGTYGIALMTEDEPEQILVARMGSPIAVGANGKAVMVASDPSPILRHTKDIVFLSDGEFAVLTKNGYRLFSFAHEARDRAADHVDWDVEEAQKGGHPHFMLKEIMESPTVLRESARGRFTASSGEVKLGGIESVSDRLRGLKRLIITGCGSAYYAGLAGKYFIETYAKIPVEVIVASELRYHEALMGPDTALLAISQSGETADTLAAIRDAKQKGMLTLGIVNAVGSTIAREIDAGIYNHAGPEIGVASTKAFLSQMEILVMLSIFLGKMRALSRRESLLITAALAEIPKKVQQILDTREDIFTIAKKYARVEHMLYIGRTYNYPIAFEGALKLKEVSYVHAEGYSAGEMKHGPIAMIDEQFPTVAIAPKDSVYEKMCSNIEEIRARRGPVIAIATEGDTDIARIVNDVIYIPKTIEPLTPLLSVIPLQLFAYAVGVERGYNVDRPRNLAKSVTVE